MDKPNKALLILDMLNDFIHENAPVEIPAGRWIIENIAGEIRYARQKGRPIIYVCDRHEPDDADFDHKPPHAVKGTKGAEIINDLSPQAEDYVVEKQALSAFYNTKLEVLLDELEIDELLICGVSTNTSVLYTAVDALQRGLRIIVPETCVAALSEEDHKFALRQINEVLKPTTGE